MRPLGLQEHLPGADAMFRRRMLFVYALASAMALASEASAHVTLKIEQAPIGSEYKAVLRLPHGCRGSAAVRLRIRIPPGVVNVKPQPKPGWQVEAVQGLYDEAVIFRGTRIGSGAKEVIWQGGRLPDGAYGEFVFQAFLAESLKPATRIYFPVVQERETGVERWIQIPTVGKTSDDYERPAPELTLRPTSAQTASRPSRTSHC
jgi:uncharacterized protein YcnI